MLGKTIRVPCASGKDKEIVPRQVTGIQPIYSKWDDFIVAVYHGQNHRSTVNLNPAECVQAIEACWVFTRCPGYSANRCWGIRQQDTYIPDDCIKCQLIEAYRRRCKQDLRGSITIFRDTTVRDAIIVGGMMFVEAVLLNMSYVSGTAVLNAGNAQLRRDNAVLTQALYKAREQVEQSRYTTQQPTFKRQGLAERRIAQRGRASR